VAHGPDSVTPLQVRLPGQVNRANALVALAAARAAGAASTEAGAAIGRVNQVAGRYATIRRGRHVLRLLLAKNPAGWAATLAMLETPRPLLILVNAREADGRDTSWLWDVDFGALPSRPIVAGGERAADLGVRLSYADLPHLTRPDPLAALDLLPEGPVDVVANYTAFLQLTHRLSVTGRSADPGKPVEAP
jgi:UDP-N-acetylmuramyl tripeptide synthase